jgi:glycosyltransferase involved in cell wall biosynthesis
LEKKVNLLFVSHSSNLLGGAEDDFERLLSYFAQKKDKYVIHGLFPLGERASNYASYCEKYGYYKWGYLPIHSASIIAYIKYILKFFIQHYQIKRFVSNNYYDLCIINVSALVWPAVSLKLLKFKVVVFIREVIQPKILRTLSYKILNRYSDYFISISNYIYKLFTDITQSKKISVIQTAIEEKSNESIGEELVRRYLSQHISERICSPKCFRILSVGAVEKKKNQLLLIQALSYLINESNIKKLFIFFVGAYDERNKYYLKLRKYIIKNNLEDYVLFLNSLPNKIVQSIMNIVDCVAITSLDEGYSIVFLEAMKNRKTIISTKVADIPDIILNMYNGILIENSTESLVNAIKSLLDNETLLKIIGERGYDTFLKINNYSDNLLRTEYIINKMLYHE